MSTFQSEPRQILRSLSHIFLTCLWMYVAIIASAKESSFTESLGLGGSIFVGSIDSPRLHFPITYTGSLSGDAQTFSVLKLLAISETHVVRKDVHAALCWQMVASAIHYHSGTYIPHLRILQVRSFGV